MDNNNSPTISNAPLHDKDITMALVNHTVDDCHAVSAAVSILSRAVEQVRLQRDFEGVDRLEGVDVMRQPVPLQRSGDSE